MIVTFSGSSGSGKSTIINRFAKKVRNCGYRVVVQEEDTFVLLKIFKMLFKSTDTMKTNVVENFYKDRTFSIKDYLTIIGYSTIVYIETIFTYFYYTYIKYDVVLVKDRYIYDYLITIENNFRFKCRILSFLYLHFPKPFLAFFIKTSFEDIKSRNKSNKHWMAHSGNNESAYRQIMLAYEDFASLNKYIILENSAEPESVVKNALDALLIKNNLKKSKSLALIGIDGTGKTTLSGNLTTYINQLGYSAKVVHFYHNSFLYQFLLLVGYFKKSKETPENYDKNRERAIEASKKGKPFYWALFHFSDGIIQSVFYRVFYPSTILIFDRSLLDFIVSFDYYRVPWREVFKRFIIRYKNEVCLICPAKISYERKPENSLEFFEKAHNAYKKLAEEYKLYLIDTAQNNTQQVYEHVLKYLSGNYEA